MISTYTIPCCGASDIVYSVRQVLREADLAQLGAIGANELAAFVSERKKLEETEPGTLIYYVLYSWQITAAVLT